MKTPVITVNPDTLLDDASRMMFENHIRRLPVVENGKLVGLVTRHLLRDAIPSSVMPLSIWGIHYQLSKMRVRDVMINDVITVTPDNTIEEVATLSAKNRIGTFPVVNSNGILVGIFSNTDLLHMLVKELGSDKHANSD
ncbi:CBS domain-containing protein [Chloroflexota bacterium]